MKKANLKDMVNGWFVGNFVPTLYRTNDVEVAVKTYKAGDHDACHFHKIATEITVIISGDVEMNNKKYQQGDIIVIEPAEASDFRAVTDAVVAAVKIPGANNDKYLKG